MTGGGGSAQIFFVIPKKVNAKQNHTPKNESIKITDPEENESFVQFAQFVRTFLSSIFSANFKSHVMNYWVVYLYLYSFNIIVC